MSYRCRSSHIGSTTLACLIREQASLHPIHDCDSYSASGYLFNTKGVEHDDFEDMGYQLDVHHDNDDG